MSRVFLIKLTLALAHLILVVCGAARLSPVPRDTVARQLVVLYGEYSGSNNGYGFFAPSVASPWEVRFSIYANGEGFEEADLTEGGQELAMRFSTIRGTLRNDNLQEAVAASLAARKFARYPDAEWINAHVRVLVLPTMAEHRAGRRAAWVTVNVYSFVHDPDL